MQPVEPISQAFEAACVEAKTELFRNIWLATPPLYIRNEIYQISVITPLLDF